MKRILASLLFATSLPAMAQIYMYTDAQGNTAYSNDPPENVVAQPVNLPPTNTMDDTPDNSSEDQSATGSSATPPASTPTVSSSDSSDDGSGGGDAYYEDDAEERREALEDTPALDAAVPGPGKIDATAPAVDAAVPGPGDAGEGLRR